MKCFYHNDLDGRCAGSIVARYEDNFNKEDYYEVDYVMELPIDKINKGERVYLVDYSFKKDTVWQLIKILQKTKDVIWIDHHTSSLLLHEEVSWTSSIRGIRADKISGAGLTYMYLYNCNFKQLPYHIKLVSDYDCWIYDYDPDTTHFKIGIETKDYNPLNIIWDLIDNKNELSKIIDKDCIIKEYIDTNNADYFNKFGYESEIEGYKCLVVNKKTNSWIFGEKYYKYPLVMVWVYDGEKYIYSIFSNNPEVDCREITEKYGGGGHKGAAGFTSNELLFKKKK